MAVQTIDADVEFAADKPLGERLSPVQHLRPRLEPNQLLVSLLGPEAIRIRDGFVIELPIFGQRAHPRLGGNALHWRKDAGFVQHRSNRRRVVLWIRTHMSPERS